jgi:hypothetical protein
MKIKTSELQGSALDWAVAKCVSAEQEMLHLSLQQALMEPTNVWAKL